MDTFIDSQIEPRILIFLERLDRVRAFTLRVTLSLTPLRAIFCHRAYRLMILFSISALVSLVTSMLFPLWVLILGPILYGIPHLFSTFRFVHYSLAGASGSTPNPVRTHALKLFGALYVTVTLIRFLFPNAGILLEISSCFLSLLGCTWVYQRSPHQAGISVLFLTPLLASALWAPLWVAGALVLTHNGVAFFYWIQAAKSKTEKRVAWLASAIFLLIHGLIFSGGLDGIYKVWTPGSHIPWATLDYSQIGKEIAPWSENYILWFHAVVAYAFGQSLHYFVWLKAIPDQHTPHQTPTSFRESYRLLSRDFGKKVTWLILGATLVCWAGWAVIQYPQARTLYFALASYHGFLEIAGLPLILLARKQ